ncbi:hypothetical protein D3C87_1033140 [compost metagenome]
MPPNVIRTKFDSPDAAGIFSGGWPDRMIDVSGMKNSAIAAPWISVGIISVRVSTPVVNPARMKLTMPKVMNAPVATQRASTLGRMRPMIGDRMIAKMPTGAMTMPASVAV